MSRKKSTSSFHGLQEQHVSTLAEAVKAFGLDRAVEKRPLTYRSTDEKEWLVSPHHQQVVDIETNNPLGVVGNRYRVVPYEVAFSPAEPLLDQGAKIIGGGAPHFGEVGYLVMELPGSFSVGRHEILNRFVLRSTHDGTGKIEVRSTPYFTANGAALTLDAARPLAFKHTPKVETRIGRARETFRRVNENWNEFTAGVQKMVAIPLTDADAKAFIAQVLVSKKESKRIENMREDVFLTFKHTGMARALPQCKGTLFGLVQAFAEWADFKRTARKSSKRDEAAALIDARLVSDAAKKKQKAWGMALYLANQKNLVNATPGS